MNGSRPRNATITAVTEVNVSTNSTDTIFMIAAPRALISDICNSAPARNAINAIARLLTAFSSASTGLETYPNPGGPKITPATR